ncbi:MAG: hypothetical protein K2I78_04640, partial [Clostridia bacterium]|nr:hypothetical protein [Clostridia bacterium]
MSKNTQLDNFPAIDGDEKKKVEESLKNIKFKYYSSFDMRILLAMLTLATFLILSPFIIISLNKGSISDFFHRIAEADPTKNYDVIAISCLSAIFLAIAIVELIRMNLINKGVYFMSENEKKVLIINGWIRKKYVINGKAYVVKRESALSIRRKEKSRFETLLSYTPKANLY